MEDDVLIELDADVVPETINLNRWENCMIVFSFEIDIVELRSRNFTKKKVETKHMEFLGLDFQVYQQKEILFTDKYIENVSQHYLIIEDLYFVH